MHSNCRQIVEHIPSTTFVRYPLLPLAAAYEQRSGRDAHVSARLCTFAVAGLALLCSFYDDSCQANIRVHKLQHTRGVQYMHVAIQKLKLAEGKRQTQRPRGREPVTYLGVTHSDHPSPLGNLPLPSLVSQCPPIRVPAASPIGWCARCVAICKS